MTGPLSAAPVAVRDRPIRAVVGHHRIDSGRQRSDDSQPHAGCGQHGRRCRRPALPRRGWVGYRESTSARQSQRRPQRPGPRAAGWRPTARRPTGRDADGPWDQPPGLRAARSASGTAAIGSVRPPPSESRNSPMTATQIAPATRAAPRVVPRPRQMVRTANPVAAVATTDRNQLTCQAERNGSRPCAHRQHEVDPRRLVVPDPGVQRCPVAHPFGDLHEHGGVQ